MSDTSAPRALPLLPHVLSRVDRIGAAGSPSPDDADCAIGEALGGVARVVDAVVVVGAEQDPVVEVGAAALGPGPPVVGLAPAPRLVAALGPTGPVAHDQGELLGRGE